MDTKNIKINKYKNNLKNNNQNFLYLMVKISKNPGQCAGKKLFFFYTKNGQNPGQCESRTLWNTVFIFFFDFFKCSLLTWELSSSNIFLVLLFFKILLSDEKLNFVLFLFVVWLLIFVYILLFYY